MRSPLKVVARGVLVVGLIAMGIYGYLHTTAQPAIGRFVDCLYALGKTDRIIEDERMADQIMRDYGETRDEAIDLVGRSEGCSAQVGR